MFCDDFLSPFLAGEDGDNENFHNVTPPAKFRDHESPIMSNESSTFAFKKKASLRFIHRLRRDTMIECTHAFD